MRLRELIKDLDYRAIENFSDCEISGIASDSHSVRPGNLFVALKGQRFDGHNFVNQAIEQGAAAVILERSLPLEKNVAKILVEDTPKALGCISSAFFGYPVKKLKIIGITGTNGKTTTSYLIESILAAAGYSSGVIGTINYRVGNKSYPCLNTTPQADALQSFLQEIVLTKSKYAIIEVSSHALAQGRVEGVEFSSAIFTNLSQEHLDYHGSLESYFSCKSALFEKLLPQGWSIINADDQWVRELLNRVKANTLTYGIEHPAQIRAENVKLAIDQLKFLLITPKGSIDIASPLLGRHNIYNILAAAGAALVEGIDLSLIAQGVKALSGVCGRLERIDCGQDFLVFVDYAHTDQALEKMLQALREVSKRSIILVFGCGGDRDKAKRPRMGKIATRLADFSIITCDNPRSEDPNGIIVDILKGIDKTANNYKIILDRSRAIRQALLRAGKSDIVVIAGKGHEFGQIFADRTIPFNDRKVVEEILQSDLTN